GCKARGDTCQKDCDCCGCFYKCHCPLDWFGGKWHPLGCSCVYGDKYICEKKKKECPNV
uniref:U7-ctenitoxin-Pr1a n=1 Tax=Phoneutria reidyi TaxID=272752 RepID=TX90B_PHORI|nr:RecName: Full=U7-ctenitoxin-Pr1a; Short=U7-CNTX-Pr1a; AltName: Full=PRTx19; AltName: Full=Probable neurotoxin PRTx20C1 [Phoneutria reidyi]